MRYRLLAAAALLIVSTGFAPAPLPKPPKGHAVLKKLQGTYEVTYPHREKMMLRNAAAAGGRIRINQTTTRARIEDEKWVFLQHNNGTERTTVTYTIVLDASKKPMWLDLKRQGTEMPVIKGIVTIEDDTVKFIYSTGGGKRPTDFENNDGRPVNNMMQLKRVTPAP